MFPWKTILLAVEIIFAFGVLPILLLLFIGRMHG